MRAFLDHWPGRQEETIPILWWAEMAKGGFIKQWELKTKPPNEMLSNPRGKKRRDWIQHSFIQPDNEDSAFAHRPLVDPSAF